MSLFNITTKRFGYIYDSNSNQIFQFSVKSNNDLKKILNGDRSLPLELRNFQQKGFLINRNIRKIKKLSFSQLKKWLESSIEKFVVEITQNCNQKCYYCPYTENFRRIGVMESETIEKVVDFILNKSKKSREIAVSFYGGEPTIEIEKIIYFVNKLKSKLKENKKSKFVKYAITTNGTLLEDIKVARFLVENKFMIAISFDGDKETHNRFRAIDSASHNYEKILRGMAILESLLGNNFNRYVKFNIVLTTHSDLNKLALFFDEFRYLKRFDQLEIFFVVYEGLTDLKVDFLEKEREKFNSLYKKRISSFLCSLIEGRFEGLSFFDKAMFAKNYYNLYSREIDHQFVDKSLEIPIPGICVPMKTKLFIDVDGNLNICEKLNYSCFGNIYDGINYQDLYSFYEKYYNQFVENCVECYAKRLCRLCYTSFVSNGKIDIEKRKKLCSSMQKVIGYEIESYIGVLEKNRAAFDYLERFVVSGGVYE